MTANPPELAQTAPPAPARVRAPSSDDRLFALLNGGLREVVAELKCVRTDLGKVAAELVGVRTELRARQAVPERVVLLGLLTTVLLVALVVGATAWVRWGGLDVGVSP